NLDNEYVTPVMSYGSKVYLEKDEKVLTVQVMDARKGNEVLSLRSTDTVTPLKINNTGVIISQKFANMYGIHEGDYITIESNTGLNGQVKVNHICECYFQHYIYMSADYYELVFDEPVHSNMLAIRTLNETQLQKQAEKFETVVSVTNFDAMIEQFNTMLRALNYIILVIIITAGSLAFVVLINLTQVNISERIREIATLKVLGFRAVEVDSYLFKEIMLLSVIGGFVGLPLGVLEHHFVMGIIDMEMIRFGTEIKLPSFIYAYVITIVFTVIVLLSTRKPLRKVEMIESLKSVE
ncbi:MAG: ABC transporter permease, partial [Erysipelotrichaceae bacterium]|nr:ABC transporter permease [Erysipelotrichaceae bacterium]